MTEPNYPAASKYLGPVADNYNARRASNPTWAWEQEQVGQYVESRLATTTKVLDVPVGTGRYLAMFLAAGWDVFGCDISADMVALAKQELGNQAEQCKFLVSPAEDIPLEYEAVDVIVCGRFIQWIPTLLGVNQVISEFSRLARYEMLIQFRTPAGPREAPGVGQALRLTAGAVRRLASRSETARITAHPEPELLAIAKNNGWHLASVGPECPSSPGLRFYNFKR